MESQEVSAGKLQDNIKTGLTEENNVGLFEQR